MANDLQAWDSELLFRASIESMFYVLEKQAIQQDDARAAYYFVMLTPILDELAERFDRLPDLGADWFNLPRGSAFADFTDLIRRTDARALITPVRLAYSVQGAIVKYYQTGSESSFKVVQRAIALHHARHGKCLDGSDEVIEIF